MAKTLQQFPSPTVSRYPWDEWLDGRVWELVPGEDFTAKVNTFKQMAQTQARRRGGRTHTRMLHRGDQQTLVMQFRRDS
jgi:hypothetical protein